MVNDKILIYLVILNVILLSIIYLILKPNSKFIINHTTAIYDNYLTNLEQNIKTKYDEHNNNILNSSSKTLESDYTITITKDLDLVFKTNDEKIYKVLDTNVLNMFLIEEGNGGFKYLYFIKKDGSLNNVCIDCYKEMGAFKINKINKKNIVNVTQGIFDSKASGFRGPIFIDIYGNVLTS